MNLLFDEFKILIIMILENIIIIIICVILTIIAILFINRDKITKGYLNCFYCHKCCKSRLKDDLSHMGILREEFKNNSLEENIKLIKDIDDSNKENELL